MLHGQEIYLFFYRFGISGMWGIIICNIIMALTIYKTLNIVNEKEIYSYKEFLNSIFKDRKFLINITNIIINIFLCATFFIMISGFGTYLSQAFEINKIIGSSILAIISYFIFLKNIEGITKINSIIIPLLIVIILIIGMKNIFMIDINQIGKNISQVRSGFWLIQSILYASYNLILLIPVLLNLKKLLKSRKQMMTISIEVGIVMNLLSILIYLLLVNVNVDFKQLEMPIIYVISNNFGNFKFIYGIIILIAIFTTAISVGIGFLNNTCKDRKELVKSAKILCILSVMISPIGFSNLVKVLFPLFGYLGLIQIIGIFAEIIR